MLSYDVLQRQKLRGVTVGIEFSGLFSCYSIIKMVGFPKCQLLLLSLTLTHWLCVHLTEIFFWDDRVGKMFIHGRPISSCLLQWGCGREKHCSKQRCCWKKLLFISRDAHEKHKKQQPIDFLWTLNCLIKSGVFLHFTCRKEILLMPLQATETSLTRRFCRSWWNTRSSWRRRTATSVSWRITLTTSWWGWWRKPPVSSECHTNLLAKLASSPRAEILQGASCWVH